MQHEFEVEIPDNQSYISFNHNGQPYVIYHTVNIEDGEEIESIDIRLSKVVVINGVNRAAGQPEVIESTNNFVTNLSSPIIISENFTLDVNEYFSDLGGGSPPIFPSDGSYWEQYDWIVGTGFSFSNGILTLELNP